MFFVELDLAIRGRKGDEYGGNRYCVPIGFVKLLADIGGIYFIQNEASFFVGLPDYRLPRCFPMFDAARNLTPLSVEIFACPPHQQEIKSTVSRS